MTSARRARLAVASVAVAALAAPGGVASAEARPDYPTVLVFVIRGVSLEELADGVGPLGGGVALMAHADDLAATLRGVTEIIEALQEKVGPDGVTIAVDDVGTPPAAPRPRSLFLDRAFSGILARVRGLVHGGGRVQVYVASDRPAPNDAARGDTLGTLAAAYVYGPFGSEPGGPGTLTSDSTRRTGVVVAGDLGYSILRRAGLPTGGAMTRAEIRVVAAPPPLELHERYVAMRRMTVPVQAGAGVYATLGGVFAVAVLLVSARRHVAAWAGMLASASALSVPVLAAALFAAGHLPTLSYATVVPFVVAITVVGTGAALALGRGDVLLPPFAVGVGALAFLTVEAIVGWTAALTPFLGGSQLDGGRFFGLPNAFTGLLLGSAMYVAARLRPAAGFAVAAAAGLFAGLPFAGADLGGAVTMFAAAGVWLPLRSRGRLGWQAFAFAGAIVVAGTALIVATHAVATSAPTHVANVEGAGAAALWSTYVRRLGIGWALIERNPLAVVPPLGVLVTLAMLLRPPVVFAGSLERRPAWRDALVAISVASVVAYLANDTGPAAAGLGFGTALGGLLYVSCADRTWKMEPE